MISKLHTETASPELVPICLASEDGKLCTAQEVFAIGAEVLCSPVSTARILVERYRPEEAMVVLRIATEGRGAKRKPAHFALHAVEIIDGTPMLQLPAIMVIAGRKGAMPREVTVNAEEDRV